MLLEKHSRAQLYGHSPQTRMQNLQAIVSMMRSSAHHPIESTWSKTVQAPCEQKHILRIPQDLVLFKPNNRIVDVVEELVKFTLCVFRSN